MKNLFLLLSGLLFISLQTGCSSGEVSENPQSLVNQEETAAPEPENTSQGNEPAAETPAETPAGQEPPVQEPPVNEPETPTQQNPPPASSGCQPDADEQLMLQLVNDARSESRQCGNTAYAATQALSWNCDLEAAALAHTQDMITNNFFDHTGSDGLNVGDRVTTAGYQWRTVGENIAAGYPTEESVMQGWLDSPGHCANIMNPAFLEFGSAMILTDTADYSSYWTQVFAASR